jgi:hypothetical protein
VSVRKISESVRLGKCTACESFLETVLKCFRGRLELRFDVGVEDGGSQTSIHTFPQCGAKISSPDYNVACLSDALGPRVTSLFACRREVSLCNAIGKERDPIRGSRYSVLPNENTEEKRIPTRIRPGRATRSSGVVSLLKLRVGLCTHVSTRFGRARVL